MFVFFRRRRSRLQEWSRRWSWAIALTLTMTALLTRAAAIFCAWGDMTVILLFFGPHRSSVRGVARVIAKVIVGSRSHVDYDGFVHHGCCHFGVWGDVTVILLFFGPPLSGVRGVARVIAKVIVGSRSHVDYDGFVHHGCRRSWTPLLPIWLCYRRAHSFGPLHRRTPRRCLCTISFFVSQEPYFVCSFF